MEMPPPDESMLPDDGNRAPERRRLLFVFGALYFVQGVAEPTEGLIAQPVRSLLRSWGHDAAAIGAFAALLSVPWMIKPLYGLATDFVPVFGSRRKGWLVLWTLATATALFVLWLIDVPDGAVGLLLGLLFVPTVGVAFTDVVVDALMVEEGQPRGLTGTLQSMQWGAMYTATILTGWLGGYLSQHGLQRLGFAICALTAGGALVVALTLVREPPAPRGEASLKGAARSLGATARHPAVLLVALFLFFVGFNPFGASVTYVHMTEALHLDESLYGETVSVQAVAAVLASATYGAILSARRLRPTRLGLRGARHPLHALLPGAPRSDVGLRGGGVLRLHLDARVAGAVRHGRTLLPARARRHRLRHPHVRVEPLDWARRSRRWLVLQRVAC